MHYCFVIVYGKQYKIFVEKSKNVIEMLNFIHIIVFKGNICNKIRHKIVIMSS